MTVIVNQRELIEEVILSGFHEGHVALSNPAYLADVAARFIEEQSEKHSVEDLAKQPVSHNHLAYLMASPEERLDDAVVGEYAELAEYILRALTFAGEAEPA